MFSMDGMQGVQASMAHKCLATHLTKQWSQPYNTMCEYAYSRLLLGLMRATNLCLRGAPDNRARPPCCLQTNGWKILIVPPPTLPRQSCSNGTLTCQHPAPVHQPTPNHVICHCLTHKCAVPVHG